MSGPDQTTPPLHLQTHPLTAIAFLLTAHAIASANAIANRHRILFPHTPSPPPSLTAIALVSPIVVRPVPQADAAGPDWFWGSSLQTGPPQAVGLNDPPGMVLSL